MKQLCLILETLGVDISSHIINALNWLFSLSYVVRLPHPFVFLVFGQYPPVLLIIRIYALYGRGRWVVSLLLAIVGVDVVVGCVSVVT